MSVKGVQDHDKQPLDAIIRVVVADDHPLVVRGLELILSQEPDIRLESCCKNGEEALALIRRQAPDILILDRRMPVRDGFSTLRQLHEEGIAVKTVLFTGTLKEDDALEAISLGVRGIVRKDMAPELLIQCIRKVHAGGEWLERRSVRDAMDQLLRMEHASQIAETLTERERQLIRCVSRSLSNKEIAAQLFISEGTVKVHLHHIYQKLSLNGRMPLAMFAKQHGLDRE